MTKQFLNSAEVADLIGIAQVTVWQWCRRGMLPHWRFNKTLRFDRREIDTFIDEARMGLARNEGINQDGIRRKPKSAWTPGQDREGIGRRKERNG